MSAELTLSTITPVFRGEKFLESLVSRLHALRTSLSHKNSPIMLGESIFVIDGATDNSAAVLEKLSKEHPWVRVITLSRNFGQHPATVAGILHSCGDWVVTLDEDLQHPPEHILDLLQHAVQHSADIVYADPTGAVHGSFVRDSLTRLYKTILSRISGNPNVRKFSSFRLLRGTIARSAAALSSHETYFDIALGWFTTAVTSLPLSLVDTRNKSGGTSGYGIWSLVRHARRLLVSSDLKLLRFGALTGFLALVTSTIMIAYVLVSKLTTPGLIPVPGWTTTIVWILFFGGLGAFLHGVSLEYMSVLLRQVQGKPTFLVIDRSRDAMLREWFKLSAR